MTAQDFTVHHSGVEVAKGNWTPKIMSARLSHAHLIAHLSSTHYNPVQLCFEIALEKHTINMHCLFGYLQGNPKACLLRSMHH